MTSSDIVSFPVHIIKMIRGLALLDRVGSLGALIAAVAAPGCFPVFGALSATVGLGALGQYETTVAYLFQAFALISIIGLSFAFARHRHFGPLTVGLLSAGLLAYTFYYAFQSATLYAGLFGLLVATLWNYFCSRRVASRLPVLRSVITCHAAVTSPKRPCRRALVCSSTIVLPATPHSNPLRAIVVCFVAMVPFHAHRFR